MSVACIHEVQSDCSWWNVNINVMAGVFFYELFNGKLQLSRHLLWFGWTSVSFIQSNSRIKGLLAKCIGRKTNIPLPSRKLPIFSFILAATPAVFLNTRLFSNQLYYDLLCHVVWVMFMMCTTFLIRHQTMLRCWLDSFCPLHRRLAFMRLNQQ